MAMANLQDGGYIIVGIAEKDHQPVLSGMEAGHLATFNQDALLETVNRYARPPVSLILRVVPLDGKQ